MDYEKKYKEALERARIWKEKSGMPKNRQGILDDIFPELKESEDERMRKALKEYFINSFQNNGVAAICGVHIKDILAWIEKQGEQKPTWSEDDERIILAISQLLKDCESENGWNCVYSNDREVFFADMENWLKSLKDRVGCEVNCTTKQQWKPSDEQMKALKEACDEHWEPDGLDPLYTLYQDLKKLKE